MQRLGELQVFVQARFRFRPLALFQQHVALHAAAIHDGPGIANAVAGGAGLPADFEGVFQAEREELVPRGHVHDLDRRPLQAHFRAVRDALLELLLRGRRPAPGIVGEP